MDQERRDVVRSVGLRVTGRWAVGQHALNYIRDHVQVEDDDEEPQIRLLAQLCVQFSPLLGSRVLYKVMQSNHSRDTFTADLAWTCSREALFATSTQRRRFETSAARDAREVRTHSLTCTLKLLELLVSPERVTAENGGIDWTFSLQLVLSA